MIIAMDSLGGIANFTKIISMSPIENYLSGLIDSLRKDYGSLDPKIPE